MRPVRFSGYLMGYGPGDVADVDETDEEVAALIANGRLAPVDLAELEDGAGGHTPAGDAETAGRVDPASRAEIGQDGGAGPESGADGPAAAPRKAARARKGAPQRL